MRSIFAQAVGEYGLMASIASAVQKVSYTVSGWVGETGPMTWVVVGAVALLVLRSLTRRSPKS